MGKIHSIYKTLIDYYGHQGWWPINNKYSENHKHEKKSPKHQFEISVGAILTQNTAWTNVEKALAELKKQNLLSKKAIHQTTTNKLAQTIKSSGYHNQKARKLKEFVKQITTKPTREQLLSIWGIGRETADSILLYAYNEPIFVIDAYTKRIFSRLGLFNKDPKNITYDELQQLFHNNLPKDHKFYNEYHALIVKHAKQHCTTIPKCNNCPLRKQCKYEDKNLEP